MGERERAERHHVELKLVYDDGTGYLTGIVRDVSDTGLFIETSNPLPMGSRICLFPIDAELFEIDATVVRIEQDDPDTSTLGGMGLEFIHGPEGVGPVHRMIEALEARQANTVVDPFLAVRIPTTKPI